MRSLRWVGLVFSLLIVGVLGGLLAPLPSEALPPTLKIGPTEATATTATLILANPSDSQRATKWPACWKSDGTRQDSGFNNCYVVSGISDTGSLLTKTFGEWTVGSVGSGNRFRVLVNDTNVVGATDDIKASGFTIKVTTPSTSSKTTHIFLENTFSTPKGDWKWAMGANLTISPPNSTETIQNDVFGLAAQGFFPPSSTTGTSIGANIAVVTYPKAAGMSGTVTRTNPTFTKTGCDTGSSKCDVKVKYDYTITILAGSEVARADDSLSGCGGTCDNGPGTNLLAPCLQTGGPLPPLVPACEAKMKANQDKDIEEGQATGAVLAETCTDTCITIILEVTPAIEAEGKQFVLHATLQGDPQDPINLTVDSTGNAGKAFSSLGEDLDPNVGDWTFDITPNDTSKTGTWRIDQWSCVDETLPDGTLTYTVDNQPNDDKGPLHVLTLRANHIAICTAHGHRDSTKKNK